MIITCLYCNEEISSAGEWYVLCCKCRTTYVIGSINSNITMLPPKDWIIESIIIRVKDKISVMCDIKTNEQFLMSDQGTHLINVNILMPLDQIKSKVNKIINFL